MQKEEFYIRQLKFTRNQIDGVDHQYIFRIIENFINLNNISKECLHSIKYEGVRIDLFFYHSGKLNVDFGKEIIMDPKSDFNLYPTCFDSARNKIRYEVDTNRPLNYVINKIGHFLNEREANENVKDWAKRKNFGSDFNNGLTY